MTNEDTQIGTKEKVPFFEKAANVPVLRFFLNSKTKLALVGKILLLVPVIPYAYIWLCGILFEVIFHWIHSATFVFFSTCGLLAIGILLSVWAIIRATKKAGKKA